MFWSLDMDDFRGLCYGNKYPLVSAISGYVNQNITGDSVTTPLIEMLKEDDIRTATNEIPPVETTSSNRVQQEEVSPTAPPQVGNETSGVVYRHVADSIFIYFSLLLILRVMIMVY